MSSYFFLHAEKNSINATLINDLENYAEENKTLLYVLDRPLTDQKYTYSYSEALIILSPKNKIAIVNYGKNSNPFEDFIEDILEDVGFISDKYLYKDVIGRPRKWRSSLVETDIALEDISNIFEFFNNLVLNDETDKRKLDLLISLFIGSINDIERIGDEVPTTTLDKVKQKIQLFDADQTRFIYQAPSDRKIRIQGLSGTGKTELLLHKLKDLYIAEANCRIYFTCWNKILADYLRNRIPSFFNFMKVEQQIEWNNRLWCTYAWGSGSSPNSGLYRFICAFYQIPFYTYSYQMSFSRACKLAIEDIKAKFKEEKIPFAFQYIFIDESQDFDDNFFELCELATEKNIYIAGDIFQSIFDENISSTIEPDFLLGKCYRTDPKTLMFAHGLGMGLFEKTKLRWLEEKEWKDCGYQVKIKDSKYHLSREPLRRFEDLEDDFESISIRSVPKSFTNTVIELIQEIISANNTLLPEDIGIILLDAGKDIYELADTLEIAIESTFGWKVNKAYETKGKQPDSVLISNRNNVKGLEFPFVICLTKKIINSPSYRNALYTMLTRSFIKSFFVIPEYSGSGLTQGMRNGLDEIMNKKEMIIEEPSEIEKEKIRTRFKYSLKKLSHYDLMLEIFKELKVSTKYHAKLLSATQQMDMLESDEETLTEFIKDNLKYLKI